MAKICSAAGCKSKSWMKQDHSFHQFPKDPILCRQWVEKCGRPDLLCHDGVTLNKSHMLCKLHFPDSDFKKMKNEPILDCQKVPSLKLKGSFTTNSVEHNGDSTVFHLMLENNTGTEPTKFTYTFKKTYVTSNSKQLVHECTQQPAAAAAESLLNLASGLLATKTDVPGENIVQNSSAVTTSSHLKCDKDIIKENDQDNSLPTLSDDDLLLSNLCTFQTENPEKYQNINTTSSRHYQLVDKEKMLMTNQQTHCQSNNETGRIIRREQVILPRTLMTKNQCKPTKHIELERSYKWNLKKFIPENSNLIVLPPVTVKADLVASKFKTLQIPANPISSTQAPAHSTVAISVKESTPLREKSKEKTFLMMPKVPVQFQQSCNEPNQLDIYNMPTQEGGSRESNLVPEPSSIYCPNDDFQYNGSSMQSPSCTKEFSHLIENPKAAEAQHLPDPPWSHESSGSKQASCKESTLSNFPEWQDSSNFDSLSLHINQIHNLSLDKEAKDKNKPISRVQKLCRTCASNDSEMIGIFSKRGQEMLLEEKIKKVLPITVRANDRLPVQVCVRCSLWLETAHDLMQTCCKAEATLSNMLELDDQQQQEQTNYKGRNIIEDDEPMEDWSETANQPITEDKLEPSNRTASCKPDSVLLPQRDTPPFLMCYDCLELSTSTNHYLKHQHTMHNRILLFCGECCVCFNTKTQFKDHWEELHSNKAQQDVIDSNKEVPPNTSDFDQENQICETSETVEQIHVETSQTVVKEIRRRRRTIRVAKCVICDLTFPTRYELKYHIHITHIAPIKCLQCNEMLPSIAVFKEHKRLHMKEGLNIRSNICKVENRNKNQQQKSNPCKHCGLQFEKVTELKAHIVEDHKEQLRQACPVCDKAFYHQRALALHIQTHDSSRPYLCDICGAAFKKAATLNTHSFSHLPLEQKKRIECCVCQKFVRGSLFEKHMQQHIDSRIYSCNTCHIRCSSKKKLRIHVSSHLKGKKCKCEICKSLSMDQQKYFEHKKDHHLNESGFYVCPVCNDIFKYLNDIVEHCKNHSILEVENSPHKPGTPNEITTESILDCNFCNNTFKDVSSYVAHRRTHPEAFSLKCRLQCDKRFKTSHGRDHHEGLHTGVKTFACDFCPKLFYLKKYLAQHLILHTNVKAFTCQYCSKKFALKKYLDFHIKIHTGERPIHTIERPYPCAKCGLTFKTPTHCKSHLAIHNETKRYGCSKCSFRSHHLYNLKLHEVTHKDITPRIKPHILEKLTCETCGQFFPKKQSLMEHISKKHT